jgi:excisionase family DNA binding protein
MTANQEKQQPILVDSREAARLLAISTRKLWSLTDCGEIPCLRIGRAVRYAVEDLQQWVKGRTTR